MATEVWRLIESGALDGATNMAMDEALVRFSTEPVPVVRFYGWQPYTISLGYHQNYQEIDLEKCHQAGIGIVRRPTGGRAIYHAREVTYSVIMPRGSRWYELPPLEVYNHISQALICGLQRLNLPVTLERTRTQVNEKTYINKFACFATSARYEIHAQGKKLVGSAQRRFEQGLLQHGSILLGPEHLRLGEFLKNDTGKIIDELNEHTICIEQLLHQRISFNEVVESIKYGFNQYFNVELRPYSLSNYEMNGTNQLKQKYTDFRRKEK